jgi:hypothetical protein
MRKLGMYVFQLRKIKEEATLDTKKGCIRTYTRESKKLSALLFFQFTQK